MQNGTLVKILPDRERIHAIVTVTQDRARDWGWVGEAVARMGHPIKFEMTLGDFMDLPPEQREGMEVELRDMGKWVVDYGWIGPCRSIRSVAELAETH